MATKKQQRRRQKLKRHEYEEVYVDDEGRELDPDEAEELVTDQPANKAKATKAQPAERGGRTIDPPSWRRTLSPRAPLLPADVPDRHLLAGEVSTCGQDRADAVLMAFFLPFSYFMDTMVWRSHQRRLAKQAGAPKKR